MRSPIAAILLSAAAIASWPCGSAKAQSSDSAVAHLDTLPAALGAQAGRLAARHAEVMGRSMLGFVSGIPIGFSAPALAYGGIGGVALGVAGIEAAGRLGDSSPPSSPELRARGDAFATAYIQSYRTTLSQRRRDAARAGGVIGGLAGFGLLYFLVTHIST